MWNKYLSPCVELININNNNNSNNNNTYLKSNIHSTCITRYQFSGLHV